jgi:hypothetical protein
MHVLKAAATLLCLSLFAAIPAHATEVRISSQALQRTLMTELFNSPDGRYYIRGSATTPCFVYADNPKVSFRDDRIYVHIRTRSKLGTTVHGSCVGVSLNMETDVSFVPEAQGESIGFRDARIEKLSDSRELNFLLEPFLSHQLPGHMKVNAADLVRKLLANSASTTGYTFTLSSLKLHSMVVQGQNLIIDLDTDLNVD